jgi:cytochrome c-type biogenesis protein CcmH
MANATPNSSTSSEFQMRLRALSEELRCLVCQNQSLADSNADLAIDLKREVERLMIDGKSDAEIKAFLVQRYGDFVLYKPPVQSNTALLWAGPFALLLAGGVAWRIAQRRSKIAQENQILEQTPDSSSSKTAARKLLD